MRGFAMVPYVLYSESKVGIRGLPRWSRHRAASVWAVRDTTKAGGLRGMTLVKQIWGLAS